MNSDTDKRTRLKMTVVFLLSRHQSQHHEDEKRALSREIIVLNNHLMEAKLTIDKLQEDNVRQRFHPNRCSEFVVFTAVKAFPPRQLILGHKCDVVPLQELYRKDCNLAAQLLHCDKSLYRAQLSEVSSEPAKVRLYSGVKKASPLPGSVFFLLVRHTSMFPIIKQIEILAKDNTKYSF